MPSVNLPGRDDIRRILVVKWSAMGDLIISTILFEDIRRAFPDATIDLNTLPQWTSLFREDTRFNNIHAVDVRRKQGGWRGVWRWLVQVGKGNYDLIVRTSGGGISGQADAMRLGIARSLVKEVEDRRADLKALGYLKRDSRKKERKKYGLAKARKAFQFSKR